MQALYSKEVQGLAQQLSESGFDVGSEIQSSEYFTDKARVLTESLCCSDTYDTILEFEDGFYLFVSNEQTGEFEPEFLGKESYFTVYVTAEKISHDDLTDGQVNEFIQALRNELAGVLIVKGDGPKTELLDWFDNAVDSAWNDALGAIQDA